MARLQTCCNLTPINKNEFAENILGASIDSNNIFTPILNASWASIPTSNFFLTLSLLSIYINIDLQKTTRLALELFV